MFSRRTSLSLLAFLCALLIALSIQVGMQLTKEPPPSMPNPPRPIAQLRFTRPIVFAHEPVFLLEGDDAKLSAKIRELVNKRDFQSLNEMGAKLAHEKERFKGGGWKIGAFSEIVSGPDTEYPDDVAWEKRMGFLHQWAANSPRSIYAKTALANGYIRWGYHIRGTGFSNDVSENSMAVFQERVAAAGEELREANLTIEEKYHGFYVAVMNVAMLQSWPRSAFESVFEEAAGFDRTYEEFYAIKGRYLQTKWGGSPGDLGSFLADLRRILGDRLGRKMYFYTVAELQSENDGTFFVANKISWAEVKKGAVYYEADNGIDRRRLNELGRIVASISDAESGCYVFGLLKHKNAFDPGIWTNKDVFEKVRGWALKDLCEQAPADREVRRKAANWIDANTEPPDLD